MKPRFLLLVLLAAAAGYFLYIYQSPETARVGDGAPDFSLPLRPQGTISLSDLRGNVVLINFWATWCPPCVQEMPSLEALNHALQGEGLKILAINVDDEGWMAIDRFVARVPVTMPILSDAGGRVSALYGTFRLPESYLIDKRGKIVQKYVGPRDWVSSAIISEIQRYLHES